MMKVRISAVINTLNEAKYLDRAIKSLTWVDEIVVVDMNSDDDTVKIAKGHGAKVYNHPRVNFVEPVRDFGISKASGEWILILDPDEEVPETLANKLTLMTINYSNGGVFRLPRKNIIFKRWMKQSMWWPDFNIRFFKKGLVSWKGVKIHRPPHVKGEITDLEINEENALVHHHYTTISDFIKRVDRYTSIQAEEMQKEGRKFIWQDLLKEPCNEFLSRYFAKHGFKDGLHGLALSLLQAYSQLIMILKLWELENFPEEDISIKNIKEEIKKDSKDIDYWLKQASLSSNPALRTLQKIKNKIV